MKDSLISIVIAVYKAETYLKKCIDSVLSQTYENLQVILVDDGSPDSCGMICEEYLKNDSRIEVYHKSNGGISDARNYGMQYMKGEYFCFIDSDDYVKQNMIEKLYNCAVQYDADISISNIELEYEDGTKENRPYSIHSKLEEPKIIKGEEILASACRGDYYQFHACNKLMNIRLKDAVQFPKGKLYEDIVAMYKAFSQANRLVFIPENLYVYLQRQNSLLHSSYRTNNDDYLKACEEVLQYCYENNETAIEPAKAMTGFAGLVLAREYHRNHGNYPKSLTYIYEMIDQYGSSILKSDANYIKFRHKVAYLLYKMNIKLFEKIC